MKKRTLAMLLVLVLIISIVPVAAMATGECEHKHTIPNPHFDGTHDILCNDCGEFLKADLCKYDESGVCTVCGGWNEKESNENPSNPTPTPTPSEPTSCTHEPKAGTYERNVIDGGHDVMCAKCGETYHENCTFKEGKCVCGASDPECKHEESIVAMADGKHHQVICRLCKAILRTEECDLTTGVCPICFNGSKSEEPTPDYCVHEPEAGTYERNVTGGHDVKCAKCGEMYHENCTFVEGKCVCGATNEDYVAPEKPACKHPDADKFYKPIDETHHKIICLNCGETTLKSEECKFVDGKCACGNEEPCDHKGYAKEYVDNEDGTHDVICSHCKGIITVGELHYYVNHKCDCGAVEPACDHMGNHWKYEDNKDGTHKVICEDCGEVVTESTPCVHEDGHACVCGSKEKAAADNTGLDKVAKTGDNGSIIVLVSATVLALFGGAYIFTKKRAF